MSRLGHSPTWQVTQPPVILPVDRKSAAELTMLPKSGAKQVAKDIKGTTEATTTRLRGSLILCSYLYAHYSRLYYRLEKYIHLLSRT